MAKELELREDMRHQRHEWRAERVGWWLMVVILLAAVLGVFGGAGPLDKTRTGQEGSALWVDHPRFARYQAPAEIRIHFRVPTGADSVRIGLNRDFYEVVEPEVRPEPESTHVSWDKVTFQFAVAKGSEPTAVTIRIRPTTRWRREVHVWMNDTQHVSFPIFIYP
jgi:hypothetical protein